VWRGLGSRKHHVPVNSQRYSLYHAPGSLGILCFENAVACQFVQTVFCKIVAIDSVPAVLTRCLVLDENVQGIVIGIVDFID
jgi:hypothetical protein